MSSDEKSKERELASDTNIKPFMLFGRDVSKIPCFRNSYLYGMGGGLAGGLLHFLFTSRTLAACNFGVYTFSGVTLIYWFQCRYVYSQNKSEMQRLQALLRQATLREGTADDPDYRPSES